MEEVSNRTLSVLLIVAIVVSLGGTLISLDRLATIQVPGITGFLATEGNITLAVSELTELNLSTLSLDFGSGTYDAKTGGSGVLATTCRLATDGINENCTGFNTINLGFTGVNVTNTGNTNITLNFSCSRGAESFIGGGITATDAPQIYYNMTDVGTPGSCADSDGILNAGFLACPSNETGTTAGTLVCGDLAPASASANQLNFQFDFIIPPDAEADNPGNSTMQYYFIFAKNVSS